jgi:DNA invertase Pin-like site-specific DNA recombinase
LTLIYQHLGLLFDSSVESKESAVGERIGYQRVSTVDQNTDRQLDGVAIDKLFTDKASGKDTNRPELARALDYVRDGDTLVVHSMDRLARNLEDLRRLVRELTGKGIRVEFVKESLTFAGDDSPMNTLLLSMLGAVAEFERSMILERQREGIALAKAAGKYKGRKASLTVAQVSELRTRLAGRESVTALAKEFGISRASVYNYQRRAAKAAAQRAG